jgi:hypothetical protein
MLRDSYILCLGETTQAALRSTTQVGFFMLMNIQSTSSSGYLEVKYRTLGMPGDKLSGGMLQVQVAVSC